MVRCRLRLTKLQTLVRAVLVEAVVPPVRFRVRCVTLLVVVITRRSSRRRRRCSRKCRFISLFRRCNEWETLRLRRLTVAALKFRLCNVRSNVPTPRSRVASTCFRVRYTPLPLVSARPRVVKSL